MITIFAPEFVSPAEEFPLVFLAGSIEMGTARPWQAELTQALSTFKGTLLNPRRLDWDSSWEQSKDNPEFVKQVTWELEALDNAHVIAMYFDPDTKSPISLLELGLHASRGNLIVCCPKDFWRKGNVDIVCARYDIPCCETFTEFVALVTKAILAK